MHHIQFAVLARGFPQELRHVHARYRWHADVQPAASAALDLENGHDRKKVPMTKDQLANVPEFKPLPSPEATTGSAPGQ